MGFIRDFIGLSFMEKIGMIVMAIIMTAVLYGLLVIAAVFEAAK
jgi:hypothetical protein